MPIPSIVAFWHVAQMNDWRPVVAEQARKLARFPRVVVCKLGAEPLELPAHFEVVHESPDLREFEYPTLTRLYEHCRNQDSMVLYLHTKGVGHSEEDWGRISGFWGSLGVPNHDALLRHQREWRRFMEYFLIQRSEACLGELARGKDLAGVSWCGIPPHFRGNFWWARSRYVRGLESPLNYNARAGWAEAPRAGAEYWIGSGTPHVANLHAADHNFYCHGMPASRYLPIHG